jgi:hypothetical protein
VIKGAFVFAMGSACGLAVGFFFGLTTGFELGKKAQTADVEA